MLDFRHQTTVFADSVCARATHTFSRAQARLNDFRLVSPGFGMHVLINESDDGPFPAAFRSLSAHQKCVEPGKNDAKSWNDTPSEDNIERTNRRYDQNTIHLENVLN
jgi:hypothetical protein